MIRTLMIGIVCAALTGCATNPRFATELPSNQISGENVCEVPQHWKALALPDVDTRKLSRVVIAQVKIPPEWIGDALGWFVESQDNRSDTYTHYPRYVWDALMVNQPTGEKKIFPAIMTTRNPLISRYLTVVITDPAIRGGEELDVYLLSGAHTKLLTVSGDMHWLPAGKGCLDGVDAEFLRTYPSKVQVLEVKKDVGAGAKFLSRIQMDYPQPSLQSDGTVYSISPMALNPQVVGDLRQVTLRERIAERGMPIVIPPNPMTAVTLGMAFYGASQERYTGPFGERLYTAMEAEAALAQALRDYNGLRHEREEQLGLPFSENASLSFDFSGRKSGWEIGQGIAYQVSEMWEELDHLKELTQFRARIQKKGGGVKEVPSKLLSSSSP